MADELDSVTGARGVPEQHGPKVGQTWDEWVYERTKSFNLRTRQNPHDIRAWLEFVDFQDESVLQHRKAVMGPVT